MKIAAAFLLSLAPLALANGQTATTATTAAKKPVVHHAATATTASTLPPNIPKVPGIPKALYTLRYLDIKVGTGDLATAQKFYTVHYTGWLAKDGTKFDSSFDHPGKEPITFPYGLHRVIPGWDTGFEGMHVGGKRRLFIPWQLAYGEAGRAPVIPAKADLIFDIELLNASSTPPAPKTPPTPPQPQPEAKPEAKPETAPPPDTALKVTPHPETR